MFHTKNARMLPVFYPNLLILPCGHVLPCWWVVFRVLTGKLTIGRLAERPLKYEASLSPHCKQLESAGITCSLILQVTSSTPSFGTTNPPQFCSHVPISCRSKLGLCKGLPMARTLPNSTLLPIQMFFRNVSQAPCQSPKHSSPT